jgi:hypothetical protein
MIIRDFKFCILTSLIFFISGCATKIDSNIFNRDLYQASDYYVVVNNPNSNMRGVDREIVSALGNYGISATILSEYEAKNSHAPVIVTYEDWYKWDLVQYLWSLEIYFHDTKLRPFAHASFQHGGFHTFPDRRNMVKQLIDHIMLDLKEP